MICSSCRIQRHEHCENTYKKDAGVKTWCDCQHKSGVYLGQEHCQHLRYDPDLLTFCPQCGKAMNDSPNSNGETTEPNQDQARTQETAQVRIVTNPQDEPHGVTFNSETPGRQRGIASERDPQTPSR